MSNSTPQQIAVSLMGPLVAEVADWVAGKGERRPKVLALLPNQLQSEVALKRLEARRALGLEPPEKKEPAIELPQQTSSLKVTTGPAPEGSA